MGEVYYIFSKALHEYLKAKIRGGVYCKIEDDILNIRIDSFEYWFETSYDNITDKIVYGLTVNDIGEEVMKKFRKFIMNHMEEKYFKTEEAQA